MRMSLEETLFDVNDFNGLADSDSLIFNDWPLLRATSRVGATHVYDALSGRVGFTHPTGQTLRHGRLLRAGRW
jgi:hypothetical protein